MPGGWDGNGGDGLAKSAYLTVQLTMLTRRSLLDMPRFRLTRATCVLALAATVSIVLFLYPSGTRAQQRHDDTPSDPFSQDSHLLRKSSHQGQQWPWLAHLSSAWKDSDEVRIEYAADGLVRGWDPLASEQQEGAEEKKKKKGYVKLSERVRRNHPIYELIEKGQQRWTDLLARYVLGFYLAPTVARSYS